MRYKYAKKIYFIFKRNFKLTHISHIFLKITPAESVNIEM